ncbi:hypothetical protein KDX23_03305 [Burkholderia vietnamiensis]|uniref:hypothetical protein n=1 Tax=Burkholderia vietnamiensis TaxID=60552 RepID=UPI001B9F3986|nr:hypothetical protein [Burkholderia vietnamiensis]MBR8081767.1 hypothetical protein [Burkholderia vietnamiensis]
MLKINELGLFCCWKTTEDHYLTPEAAAAERRGFKHLVHHEVEYLVEGSGRHARVPGSPVRIAAARSPGAQRHAFKYLTRTKIRQAGTRAPRPTRRAFLVYT